ncbi:MAG: hypothetical protein SPF41_06695 [Candidatus Merdousia sp.]|nr:hypothetical protein [Candidatus Merdousia sp.]
MDGLEILGATGAGAVVGGVLTWITALRKESHERQLAVIDKLRDVARDADDSADKAAARDCSCVGQRVRQFIIAALIFSFVVAPFIFAWTNIPIAVERTEEWGGYLWGIVPEYTRQVIDYAAGFYIPAEFKVAFMAIVGFYFGRSAAR